MIDEKQKVTVRVEILVEIPDVAIEDAEIVAGTLLRNGTEGMREERKPEIKKVDVSYRVSHPLGSCLTR